ncbi:hypothetical protein H5410_036016 [Solanum commersonii]|uniref:Uncharacterized protein n=1 Tax=Solanum commersonii TaxID=4109 RepID=A0A9J5Y5A7_SOLCO|nr:hypothetical protein H5410_036016 [Solanum commersonii]
MEKLRNMHVTQCHKMVIFKFLLANLKGKMIIRMEVDATPYPMAEKSEEEFCNLHIASCCNQSKPIAIKEVKINEMILPLQENTKKIIHGNFISCGIKSVTQLRSTIMKINAQIA